MFDIDTVIQQLLAQAHAGLCLKPGPLGRERVMGKNRDGAHS
jgi:hypothetical protein